MLPKIEDKNDLEIATVRCRRTTATPRTILSGVRSLNKDYADEHGRVSMARICERQPSFKEPLERGLKYNVISGLLVTRCPNLMKPMAQSGNADHGTARMATTVQRAKKVWMIAKCQESLDTAEAWEKVERLAAIGMSPEFGSQLPS